VSIKTQINFLLWTFEIVHAVYVFILHEMDT